MMVAEVRLKDGRIDKYIKVTVAGILGSWPDQLYIQMRTRSNVKEIFIPLDRVKAYQIREAVK